MLTISPANTLPALTAPSARAKQEPATAADDLPTVTYYRTIPTDALQCSIGAGFSHARLGARTYVAVQDTGVYRALPASTFQKTARRKHMTGVGIARFNDAGVARLAKSAASITDQIMAAPPDVMYCACDPEIGADLGQDLARSQFHGPHIGGDALLATPPASQESGTWKQYATVTGADLSKRRNGSAMPSSARSRHSRSRMVPTPTMRRASR
jgi:ABC-type branched-subunit amino acid transport system substrate-binding protein